MVLLLLLFGHGTRAAHICAALFTLCIIYHVIVTSWQRAGGWTRGERNELALKRQRQERGGILTCCFLNSFAQAGKIRQKGQCCVYKLTKSLFSGVDSCVDLPFGDGLGWGGG